MRTHITTRGKVVLAIAVLGFALGWGFGGRNLNVVVVPAVVLLVATGLYVLRFSEPRVIRHAPTHGHQGETRRHDLFVESDIGYPATVRERTSSGLSGLGADKIVTDGRWIRNEITFERRGRQTIGPTRITATDPLGLWEREFTHPKTETVVVFPRIRNLAGEGYLLRDFVGITDERDRFDTVREYKPGDPLRDINWKASAKRQDDLVVTQFAGEGAVTRVTIAAEALGPASDTVAEATASVALFLIDAGLAVGLRTVDGYVEPGHGEAKQREVLEQLAVLEQGSLRQDHRRDADILVQSPRNARHVEITTSGDSVAYSQLFEQEGVISA